MSGRRRLESRAQLRYSADMQSHFQQPAAITAFARLSILRSLLLSSLGLLSLLRSQRK
jgi:hypothetical protein